MRQNLSDVHDSLRFLLPVQPARDVHETACLSHDQCGGLCRFKIAIFRFNHSAESSGCSTEKIPPKPQHSSAAGKSTICRASDICKQGARLAVHVHAAQEYDRMGDR